jgi:hypothetical protein
MWISPREICCAGNISYFDNFIARAGKMKKQSAARMEAFIQAVNA